VSLQGARYQLPLAQPLRLGDQSVQLREGWLLRRGDAIADVCPLPAFSTDTLDDVEQHRRGGAATASVTWALHALDLPEHGSVATAGLATGIDAPCQPQHACVKLKVGRDQRERELDAIARLRAAGLRLRLDGNRSLALDDAQRLAHAAGDALEFFEEPVAASELEAALQRLPIALDETLLERRDVPSGAAAFVLKPTILGAPRTVELVELAQTSGVPCVVSSAYECAVGRAALVRFAAQVAPDTTHGLGTGPAFARDFEGWVTERGERLTAASGELPEEDAWVAF